MNNEPNCDHWSFFYVYSVFHLFGAGASLWQVEIVELVDIAYATECLHILYRTVFIVCVRINLISWMDVDTVLMLSPLSFDLQFKICLDMHSQLCNEHFDTMIKSPSRILQIQFVRMKFSIQHTWWTYNVRVQTYKLDAHSVSIIIIVLCISRITSYISCAIHRLHKLTDISVLVCIFIPFSIWFLLFLAVNISRSWTQSKL